MPCFTPDTIGTTSQPIFHQDARKTPFSLATFNRGQISLGRSWILPSGTAGPEVRAGVVELTHGSCKSHTHIFENHFKIIKQLL